jgi:heme o synthase
VTAWVRHRREPALLYPATLAFVLLVVQVLLGAVTVKLALPPWVIIIHLANAMVLLATLLVVALRAGEDGERAKGRKGDTTKGLDVPSFRRFAISPTRHPSHTLILAEAALGFTVILFGAQVANFHAGLLCLGLPLCDGSVLPPATPLAALHWTHRVLAFAFLTLAAYVAVRVRRKGDGPVRRWSLVVLCVTVAQIAVAFAMVLNLLPPSLRALHLLVGSLVWAALVVLMYHSGEMAKGRKGETYRRSVVSPPPSLASDLVALTKPRIISLLLVTTIAPMFITPAGLPSLTQIFWVAVGGYLMAGGANAINMWFDRDIDSAMSRTRLRPIPAGRISPTAGLAFGLVLGGVAFTVFWFLVNPLSAWLALGGLLFYVFVYTIWLKRTSPQNIVIGGAAGAFPPLVGWAAMTGRLDLAAVYLFAIIFYWTPPHFWALALIKQADYAKAGVPMLPVVRGEARTKYEMLVYTLVLLPLTIMPTLFGALGVFYGVAAAILGARLLWYCVRLIRERGVTPLAWQMYRYSLLYLALLFVAMGIDRALPFGHRPAPKDVIILDRPDEALIAFPAIAFPAAAEHQH